MTERQKNIPGNASASLLSLSPAVFCGNGRFKRFCLTESTINATNGRLADADAE